MSDLYRPGNGTDGMIFVSQYCDNCEKDRMYRKDPDSHDGCQIVAKTFAYDIGDPRYPKEWCYEGGEPTCTAFECERTPGESPPTPRDTRTGDLFT